LAPGLLPYVRRGGSFLKCHPFYERLTAQVVKVWSGSFTVFIVRDAGSKAFRLKLAL